MELIDRQAALDVLCDACGNCACPKGKIPRCSYYEKMQAIPTASPWHRVEDGLPEPHKDVLVTGMEAINNSRVYKVVVNDNGTWRPTDYAPSIRWDYWMPIEPPKEDA